MKPDSADPKLLEQRLEAICEGFKEAIRREVLHLRDLGLPIYVAENGRVMDRGKNRQHRNSSS